MRLPTKLVALAGAAIMLSAAPLTAAQASTSTVAAADCTITPHADWRPAEVHVRCRTTGPFKAIALCTSKWYKDKWFESPWTSAGSTAQVACPLTDTLTGWGKQGGGSA
ncbi:hypothetical protein [Nonomuraea zeae]|uniref:Secreted protein n=1 Tax=Nonomuraea zeae TaxID=1642303 RepID=A0A5S4GME4_9ACTN|nr:hypothetical protein [Nonomuraea zeae]TMR33972.1 hypothetical protein ETD85_18310 [Nonomuraea zeae]